MTYVITTTSPGGDLDSYHRVNARIGDEPPAGLLHHFVGIDAAGNLAITSVWASKADGDRFAAERLLPALREVLGDAGGNSSVIDFEVAG